MTVATLDGQTLVRAVLRVPAMGPWICDCDFAEQPDVSGRVDLRLAGLSLVGTVDERFGGTFGLQRRVRVVAGGGGWGRVLPARAYHNDAGLRARLVADDAAREAGEQLGSTFAPALEQIGIDFVRQAGPAARTLEELVGGVPWWVAYDGTTLVGARAEIEARADAYEVLDHDTLSRVVTLALDDLTAIGIGSVLARGLDEPQTVRELEVELGEALLVRVWCGGAPGTRGRLANAFEAAVRRASPELFGVYRYRAFRMSGDRVELQAVVRGAGLPDVVPASMWAGVAGAHAELADGAEVLVQFIEGRRSQPFVSHYAGKDGAGWTPTNVAITASSTVRLADANASEGVARSSATNDAFDSISAALDAFCAGVPVSMDGGAALQTAVKLVWGTGTPPTPPSDVGSDRVFVP